ncbi:MAG: DUF3618 domain-containing protein [Pseudomonadota bacterium]|jgi:ElaB/YqjD/DUF883 family membrane-anchored ribosome-binding protein|nr:DUF3618 domain-containing protein [Pseudomonadota bacterium]
MDSPEILAARADAEQAKSRLMATIEELQQRIAPRTLARDAWDGAKSKGADMAEDAVDAVRARPVAAGGIVAALALFLAREPLMNLAGKAVGGKKRRTRKAEKTQDEVESDQ